MTGGLHRVPEPGSEEDARVRDAVRLALGIDAPPLLHVVMAVDDDQMLHVASGFEEQWAWQRMALQAVTLAGLEDYPELGEVKGNAVVCLLLDAIMIQRGGIPVCGRCCGGGVEGIKGHCPKECCHGRPLKLARPGGKRQ